MTGTFAAAAWKPSPKPSALVAALAATVLLSGAPAAAAGEGDEARHEVKDRRMIVVSVDGEGKTPAFFTRVLGGGYLGVELTALTPELRAHFGAPADRGVMVARVADDSPAARAGLQVGDVITDVDAAPVEGPWDLSTAVRSREAGAEADLVVWRAGRALDFRVTLEERERQKIDLGSLMQVSPDGSRRILELRDKVESGELPTLYFEPESVERLQDALRKIEWPELAAPGLVERNRELEERLEQLEERLQELEETLRRSER